MELVTILILIDGFLQSYKYFNGKNTDKRHNPYFNRWFSAIIRGKNHEIIKLCHNPYFNRWFSAIRPINNVKKLL